jgi:hypothetical protein
MTIKHSFLPPSGAHAWSRCALWPTMNSRYPESNTTSAEEGTAAHWVFAPSEFPAEGSLAPNGIAVTAEMLEGAELLRDVVEQRIPANTAVHVEETVSMPQIHSDCYGTPDIWAAENDNVSYLEIIDYKFGHGFVDEYWNPQGLLYMAGILAQLPFIPSTIRFTIVQPRCYYKQPVRTHTYKLSEATPYLKALREAAERATQPEPTATTGPQCEHCPGRHACPTLQRAASIDSETSTDQQPVDLTPSAAAFELRMLEKALGRLEARVTGLRELTTANLKGGKQVPHYKLEPGRSSLKWTVSPEEVIKLGKKHKAKLDTPKVLTPTQAKKLIPESIIATVTAVIPGALRLIAENNVDVSRIFGHTSNNANRSAQGKESN